MTAPQERQRASAATRKRLDALLRQAVLLRDGNTCRRCGAGKKSGRGGGIQAAHILPKGTWRSMRYDMENGIALCASCHIYGKGAWHKDPDAAIRWATKHLGKNFIARLRERGRMLKPRKDPILTELFLQQVIKRLEAK